MKNVTGLDLVKLQAGAWGTLGLLTEVTFKVLPAPEFTATILLSGLSDREGIAALSEALGSPFEISAAAHLPSAAEAKSSTAVRLEGFEASVRYRAGQIARLWKERGAATIIFDAASRAFWRDIRDVAPLAQPRERAIWRISVKPSVAPNFVSALGGLVRAHFYDWGGGLVWLATDAEGDAGASTIRHEIARLGDGHALLLRAPAEIRAVVPVFQPLAPAVERLQRRLKASLDPAGIFNPGRMYP